MSKRRNLRTCSKTGKRRYRDLAEAKGGIRIYAGRPGKIPKRAYLCPFCNGYHLTSQEEVGTHYEPAPRR